MRAQVRAHGPGGCDQHMTGGFSLGQLIGRRRRACGANQPIRLFQNAGICRLQQLMAVDSTVRQKSRPRRSL